MLDSVEFRARGQAAIELRRYFSNLFEEILQDFILDAVTHWSLSGFDRRDDHERSCTARLFSAMLAATSRDPEKYVFLTVCVDGIQPTPDMLAGLADLLSARRPDFTIWIGDRELRLEAKVLRAGQKWAKAYVTEGMARFLDGRYGSPGVPGVMLGYVLEGTASEYEGLINLELTSALTPESERLRFSRLVGACVRLSISEHTIVRLFHYLLELTAGVLVPVPEPAGPSDLAIGPDAGK